MRVTRNADIDVDEGFDSELDFRQNMSELINKRKRLCPVRLQLSKQISDTVLNELLSRLELSEKQVFVEKTPLDMSYVFAVFDKAADRKELFFPKQEPQPSAMIDPSRSMIEQIDEKDLFLHYPYESIKPFIRQGRNRLYPPKSVRLRSSKEDERGLWLQGKGCFRPQAQGAYA